MTDKEVNPEASASQEININALQKKIDCLMGRSPEAIAIMDVFPEISSKWITQIIYGVFDPLNLLELIPDTIYSLGNPKEATGTIKDFGETGYRWLAAFGTYVRIMSLIFGAKHASLTGAILQFQIDVIKLLLTYEWEEQVLPFAINHHRAAISRGVTSAEHWIINPRLQNLFCSRHKTEALEDARALEDAKASKDAWKKTTKRRRRG